MTAELGRSLVPTEGKPLRRRKEKGGDEKRRTVAAHDAGAASAVRTHHRSHGCHTLPLPAAAAGNPHLDNPLHLLLRRTALRTDREADQEGDRNLLRRRTDLEEGREEDPTGREEDLEEGRSCDEGEGESTRAGRERGRERAHP